MPRKPTKADKELFRASDWAQFLVDAMQGKPTPVRDLAGRVVGQDEPLEYEKRIDIAKFIGNKLIANASQPATIKGDGHDGITILLGDDVAPPASSDEPIDITPEPELIEHHEPVPPAPVRRRQKDRADG